MCDCVYIDEYIYIYIYNSHYQNPTSVTPKMYQLILKPEKKLCLSLDNSVSTDIKTREAKLLKVMLVTGQQCINWY